MPMIPADDFVNRSVALWLKMDDAYIATVRSWVSNKKVRGVLEGLLIKFLQQLTREAIGNAVRSRKAEIAVYGKVDRIARSLVEKLREKGLHQFSHQGQMRELEPKFVVAALELMLVEYGYTIEEDADGSNRLVLHLALPEEEELEEDEEVEDDDADDVVEAEEQLLLEEEEAEEDVDDADALPALSDSLEVEASA